VEGDLRFDSGPHKYFWQDREIPSVTTVLNHWRRIEVHGDIYYYSPAENAVVPAYFFEAAQFRGNEVHKMLELCLTGQGVDKSALDPSLHGYLKGIEDWMTDYQPEPLMVEKPLCDVKAGFAGKPDFYGRCKGIKNKVLADGKSGEKGPIDEQLAAYEHLVRIETKERGLIDRYHLHLMDGSYEFLKIGSPTDFTRFKLKLSLYNFERRTA
jgi:hypothetical protein